MKPYLVEWHIGGETSNYHSPVDIHVNPINTANEIIERLGKALIEKHELRPSQQPIITAVFPL